MNLVTGVIAEKSLGVESQSFSLKGSFLLPLHRGF